MKEYKMPFDEEANAVSDFMEATEWLDKRGLYNQNRAVCESCGRDLPSTEFPRDKKKKYCFLCLEKKSTEEDINRKLSNVYRGILDRCNNPTNPEYSSYGGRGIVSVFQSKENFINYVKDYHKEYSPGYEIHRIDNNGNYEPGNIRFVPWIVHVNIHKE